MPVIANVHTQPSIFCFKHRISQVAGREIKLLPKSGMAVRDVVLAVFPKIVTIRVYHRCRIEIDSRHLLLVHRNHNHHAVFGRDFLHQLCCGAFRHALGELIPARVLFCAKIGTVEKLLQTKNLCLLLRSLLDQLHVLLDHGFLDLWQGMVGAELVTGLNQATADNSGHTDLRGNEL